MKDIPDEIVVEFGYQIADRVLQPGRPGPIRHHPADDVLGLFRVAGPTELPGFRGLGRWGQRVGGGGSILRVGWESGWGFGGWGVGCGSGLGGWGFGGAEEAEEREGLGVGEAGAPLGGFRERNESH